MYVLSYVNCDLCNTKYYRLSTLHYLLINRALYNNIDFNVVVISCLFPGPRS